jgi:hypothetical protein
MKMTKEQANAHLKRLQVMSTKRGWDGQRARLMRELHDAIRRGEIKPGVGAQ